MSETETYRVDVVVSDEGTLTVTGLPLHAGDRVQVIVRCQDENGTVAGRYPLRGKPYRYDDPFKAVAEDDWDAVK